MSGWAGNADQGALRTSWHRNVTALFFFIINPGLALPHPRVLRPGVKREGVEDGDLGSLPRGRAHPEVRCAL